jgi:hypothetical protein
MMREKSWKRKKKRKMMMKRGRLKGKGNKTDSELKKTRMGIPGLY